MRIAESRDREALAHFFRRNESAHVHLAIREGGEIVAAGGVHVLSERYGVVG